MIKIAYGDIFSSGAESIVNPVNCVGVMGAGLALDFKNRFPKNYEQYVIDCKEKIIKIGSVTYFEEKNTKIFNFPTKLHWKDNSKIEYIRLGIKSLISEIEKRKIRSVCLPALGCGLGGLDIKEVTAEVIDSFEDLEIEAYMLCRKKK